MQGRSTCWRTSIDGTRRDAGVLEGARDLPRRYEGLELTDSARVTALPDLPLQHRRRNPMRSRCLDPLEDIAMKRLEHPYFH
jgi:hypothetical protein